MDAYAAQESSNHTNNGVKTGGAIPEGHNQHGERAASSSSSSSLSHSSSQSSLPPSTGTQQVVDVGDLARSIDGLALDGASTPDVDASILEALKSKDRLFVLKLGEQMEALIKEKHFRTKYSLNTDTTYQRLLVHRCAGYYKLTPESETGSKMMSVVITMESKIPPRRICELVPPEEASHPAFKIMRRADLDRKKQKSIVSHPGSVAGEDGELSDVDPSEAGSMGSRSTTSKTRKTIAERQAEYDEARTRIFMNFKEKEKKERSASASSSSLSLISPSEACSQNGAGEAVGGDVDDSASSAPTESEWSVSYTGDRMRSVDSSTSTTFPYGSTTSSGRASPSSVNYPSLSSESPGGPAYGYDPNASFSPPAPHPNGYYSPYPAPGYPYPAPVPGPPFTPPQHAYPYYPQYQYGPPPPQAPIPVAAPHHHSASDPGSPVTHPIPIEGYPRHSPPAQGAYGYVWTPSQPPGLTHPGTPVTMSPQHPFPPAEAQSPSVMHPPPGPPHPNQGGPMMYGPQPYPGYMPPPMGYPQYPMQYYPPPQVTSPIAQPQAQMVFPADSPPTNGNGNGHDRQSSSGGSSPTFSRSSSSMSSGNGMNHAQHPGPHRAAWSYGPGVGSNGVLWGPNNAGVDKVGPRMNPGMRRTSGASSASGSGSSGYRTPGEEASSATSSSASSTSSRRTYMTTHPLPPRPDWATGLRPQPTLHAGRNRHHDGNGSSRNSPARSMMQLPPIPPLPHQQHQQHQHQQNHQNHQNQNQNQRSQSQPLPQPVLQPNDFPPLSSSSVDNTNTKKQPAAGGVWTIPGGTARTILKATKPDTSNNSPSANNNYGNALFNHQGQSPRMDDDERGFERPPPKSSAELFNPKGSAATAGSPVATSTPAKRQHSLGGVVQEKTIEKEKKRADSMPGGGASETAAAGSVSARLAAEMANGDRKNSESPSS